MISAHVSKAVRGITKVTLHDEQIFPLLHILAVSAQDDMVDSRQTIRSSQTSRAGGHASAVPVIGTP